MTDSDICTIITGWEVRSEETGLQLLHTGPATCGAVIRVLVG